MPSILKSAALGVGVLLYVWVAGVRNLDEVKERKQSRQAVSTSPPEDGPFVGPSGR